MKTFSSLRISDSGLHLYVGIGLTVLCFAVGFWFVSFGKTQKDEKLVRVAQPQVTGKHSSGKVHFDILAKLLADDRRGPAATDWLQELADPKAPFRVETQRHPFHGCPAPDFTLNDNRGQPWSLQSHIDKGPVVLVFYLGYFCNACVSNLFEINADVERFRSLGAAVVAVSGDSSDLTQQRFEQYGEFSFKMLTDPGHAVAQSYGTFQPKIGSEKLLHGTFLIGRDRQVHWVHYGDTPFRNNKALLYELTRLEESLPHPEPTLQPGEKEP